jgi:hypothetical protein
MVNDPFGLPHHGLHHVFPSGVSRWKQLHERIQDRERFPVRPPPFCLTRGVAQGVNRLDVAG